MKREEAFRFIQELCPEQKSENVVPLQGFNVFDPSHGVDPEGFELRLIISAYSKDHDFVKCAAEKFGLALKLQGPFLVVYSPRK